MLECDGWKKKTWWNNLDADILFKWKSSSNVYVMFVSLDALLITGIYNFYIFIFIIICLFSYISIFVIQLNIYLFYNWIYILHIDMTMSWSNLRRGGVAVQSPEGELQAEQRRARSLSDDWRDWQVFDQIQIQIQIQMQIQIKMQRRAHSLSDDWVAWQVFDQNDHLRNELLKRWFHNKDDVHTRCVKLPKMGLITG